MNSKLYNSISEVLKDLKEREGEFKNNYMDFEIDLVPKAIEILEDLLE